MISFWGDREQYQLFGRNHEIEGHRGVTGASLPDLQWVSAAYALVLAVLLLPAATLGDRLGRRRLFLAGLVIFTAGSLACALAWTAMALQLFRTLLVML
jgi:MFS family permease